jgi:hypothetical protein
MFLGILYPAIRERDRLEASAACLRARLRETTGLL